MHPLVDIDELKTEIEKHNHKIVSISNISHSVTHKPLPLFFVEIESNENYKQIFQINFNFNQPRNIFTIA